MAGTIQAILRSVRAVAAGVVAAPVIVFGTILLLAPSLVTGGTSPANALRAAPTEVEGTWVVVRGEVSGQPIASPALPLLWLELRADGSGSWSWPGTPRSFAYTVQEDSAGGTITLELNAGGGEVWPVAMRWRRRGATLDLAFAFPGPPSGRAATPPDGFETSPAGSGVSLSLEPAGEAAGGIGPGRRLSRIEAAVLDAVRPEEIERITRALVAPELEGRGAAQPGGVRAAELVAAEFRRAGLEPGGDGGFLQAVPVVARRMLPESFVEVDGTAFGSGEFAVFAQGHDVGATTDVEGDAVLFAPLLAVAHREASLPAPDVAGRVVVVPFSPVRPDGREVSFGRTYEALVRSGARAILFVAPQPLDGFFQAHPLFATAVGLRRADVEAGREPPVPLVLGAGPTQALLGEAGEALFGRVMAGESLLEPLGRRVAIFLRFEDVTAAPSYNVAGVLRGSDASVAAEAIVFTAHHDAYGIQGGELFPGAADNALGTAELIAMAGALTESGARPRRSIVFVAVGAEEYNLLGATHWTERPTWLLDDVLANINLDGGDAEAWGPLHGVLDLVPRHSTLNRLAASAAADLGLPLIPNPGPPGMGGADFMAFAEVGIPATQLLGIGGDPKGAAVRYRRFGSERMHQPGDVVDPDWDWDGPTEMARLYLLLGLRIANGPDDALPRVLPSSPYAPPSREEGLGPGTTDLPASGSRATQKEFELQAREAPVAFTSGGDTVRGTMRVEEGAGPHQTVHFPSGIAGWLQPPDVLDRRPGPAWDGGMRPRPFSASNVRRDE